MKWKDHPKCCSCTLNDEETNILQNYILKKGYASGKFHIFLQRVLTSGLFPLPLVFSSSPDFFSMLCPILMMFFKSFVFVRGALL